MHTLRATAERRPTATLLTTIEPTSSLRPEQPSGRRMDLTRGFGIAFDGRNRSAAPTTKG